MSDLNTDLMAYYPFDGNANDQSGNDKHGTVHGAVLTEDRFGNPNSAYLFDGANDYISFPVNQGPISGTGDFSLSAFFKTSSADHIWIMQQRDGSYYGYQGYYKLGILNGKAHYEEYRSGSGVRVTSAETVNDGKWHHVAFVRDSEAKKGFIYIDGALSASADGIIKDISGDLDFAIGKNLRDNNRFFNGSIADVRVYNRTLTAEDIKTLNQWEVISTSDSSSEGLALHYPFDGNANDASGNGNNGTVYGATLVPDRNGNANSAYNLDGVDDYIYAPNFKWDNGGPVSVIFWAKTDNLHYNVCFTGGGQNDPNRFQTHVGWPDGNLYWDYGNCNGTGRAKIGYSSYLTKWTHIALVSEGNGGNFMGIYLNGTLVAQTSQSDGPDVSLTGFAIGNYQDIALFKGQLDDFRVYNRVLSAEEISALHQGTSQSSDMAFTDVNVGVDGTTWAIGPDVDTYGGRIYKRDGDKWIEPNNASRLTQISVGNANNIWGVNKQNNIFKYVNNAWSQVSGGLKHVSAGPDGTVWGVAPNDEIFRRDGSSWTRIHGRLKQISVGSSNQIWGVNSSDYIYTWQDGRWVNISGRLKWVSVASDGTIWGVNSANQVFRRKNDSWDLIEDSFFQKVSAGNSSSIVGLGPDGKLFKLKAEKSKGPYRGLSLGWRQEDYELQQVSIGMDGKIWGIGTDNIVRRRDGDKWYVPGAKLKQVSVADKDNVWAVNMNDQIYKRKPDQTGWWIFPGRLKCVSIGSEGEVWGVNASNYIYRKDGGSWTRIPGSLKHISVGSKEHIWGICPNNKIWKRDVKNDTWTKVDDGPFKWVSVGFDGTVWAIETDDDIFVREGNKWRKVNGKLKQISVGSATNVIGVNSENRVYTLTMETGVNLYSIGCKKSGKMLSVAGGSADRGANVIQWEWDGTPSQKWKIVKLEGADDRYYRIENCISGKVLDVSGASPNDGANIHVWDSNNTDAQKWRVIPVGEAEFKLVPKCSGKAVDVAGGSTNNGANVLQWKWHGGDNQRWCLTPIQWVPPASASGAGGSACAADASGEGESSIFGTTLWTGLEAKCGKDICGLALACGAAAAGFALCGVVAAGAVACGADVAGIGVCGAAACGANVCGAAVGGLTACAAAACAAAACGADACGAAACGGAACGAAACGAAACGADACGVAAAGASASLVGACAIDVPLLEACAANTCAVNLCPADACAADACAVDVIPIVPGI